MSAGADFDKQYSSHMHRDHDKPLCDTLMKWATARAIATSQLDAPWQTGLSLGAQDDLFNDLFVDLTWRCGYSSFPDPLHHDCRKTSMCHAATVDDSIRGVTLAAKKMLAGRQSLAPAPTQAESESQSQSQSQSQVF
jgi:hypothetical protein